MRNGSVGQCLSVPTCNTAWLRHPRTAPIGRQQGQVRHLCQQEQQLDAVYTWLLVLYNSKGSCLSDGFGKGCGFPLALITCLVLDAVDTF